MKRLALLFTFIVFQIGLSLTVGYLVIDAAARQDDVAAGTSYMGVELSGTAIPAAVRITESAQREVISADGAAASFRYRDVLFQFAFSEIGLAPNPDAILSALDNRASANYLSRLLSGFTRGYKNAITPAYSADPELFRGKLNLMKNYIDSEPVGAYISCSEDGTLSRTAAVNGASFDVDAMFDVVYAEFLKNPDAMFSLENTDAELTGVADTSASDTSVSDTGVADTGVADTSVAGASAGGSFTKKQGTLPVITLVKPDVTNEMLRDVDTLLADVEVEIPAGLVAAGTDADTAPEFLKMAAEAVDTVWIPGSAATEFSFNRYLTEAGLAEPGLSGDAQLAAYNAVAATLLYALLVAGEDYGKISYERAQSSLLFGNRLGEDDRMFGFEVSIKPDSPEQDLRFTNTLPCNIVIFCSVAENSIRVRIAGDGNLAGANAAPFRVYTEFSEGTNVNTGIGGADGAGGTQNGTVRLYRNGELLDTASTL